MEVEHTQFAGAGGESSCETNNSPRRIRMMGGRGWLSGIGIRSSSSLPASSSTSSPTLQLQYSQRRASAIADDIRNDHHNLFFRDDESPPPAATYPSMSTTVGLNSGGGGTTHYRLRESSSTTDLGFGLPRRSSQEKLEYLQRDVDLALEYFHQETENELDEIDGDEYLTHRNRDNNYPRMETTDHRCHDYGSYGDEYDDSLPETDATSNSTSVGSNSNHRNEPMSDANFCSAPSAGIRGLSMQHRTKSIISLPLSLLQSQSALNALGAEDDASPTFHNVVADELSRIRGTEEQRYRGEEFNTSIPLRSAMEPYLAAARTFDGVLVMFRDDIITNDVFPIYTLQSRATEGRGKTRSVQHTRHGHDASRISWRFIAPVVCFI